MTVRDWVPGDIVIQDHGSSHLIVRVKAEPGGSEPIVSETEGSAAIARGCREAHGNRVWIISVAHRPTKK